MALTYIFIFGWLLLKGLSTEAAAFSSLSTTAMSYQTIPVSMIQDSPSLSQIPLSSPRSPPLTSLPPVSHVTPPPSANHLELRQRCWNDQGFSVDCAIWTGYRYTWGPSSNPYDYWSGAGGRGSGGGGAVSSDASKAESIGWYIAIMLPIFIGITIYV